MTEALVLKNSSFMELTQDEMSNINGGAVPFLVGLAIGVGVSIVVDAVVIAATGKSSAEHLANGIKAVGNAISNIDWNKIPSWVG